MFDLRTVMDASARSRGDLRVSEGGPMAAVFAATYRERTAALVIIGTFARRLRDIDYPWGPTGEEREHYLEKIPHQRGGPIGLDERAPLVANDRNFAASGMHYLSADGRQPRCGGSARPILPVVRVPTLVIHRSGERLWDCLPCGVSTGHVH